jgi:hypothetical protein
MKIASRLGCVIAPVGSALAQERQKMVKSDELTWNEHPMFTCGILGRALLAPASNDDVSPTLGNHVECG